MSLVSRIRCPMCGAECIEQESNCWQCGKPLRTPPPRPGPEPDDVVAEEPPPPAKSPRVKLFARKRKEPERKVVSLEDVLTLDGLYTSDTDLEETPAETADPEHDTATAKRTMVTLTGEVVAIEDSPAPENTAATIGETEIDAESEAPVYIQTYCSNCGYQNQEGVHECKKCGAKLAVLSEPPGEIEELPRAWGFDVLGAAWIVLGLSAIYSGIFLIQADHRSGTTISDYFWTLIVAAAPGILIFMRHVFCKILFWVMSFVSLMIWLIIGFIWLYVGLHLTNNGQVGLTWFAVFSALSFASWFTVRVNDEFDYSL